MLDERRSDALHVDRLVQLDDADRPEHAHVGDGRETAAGRESLA